MSFILKLVTILCGFMMVFDQGYSQRDDFSSVSFNRADSIAGLYNGYPLSDSRKLVCNLTRYLPSDVEKFRAIYKWVCNNIEFDYSLYIENKLKRHRLKSDELVRWNRDFNKRLFRELIVHQRTVCTGYA